MKYRVEVCCFVLLASVITFAQSHESYRELLTPQVRSPKLSGPQHLRDYVRDGKLRLSLNDAILLTLENNSSVHVQEAPVENAKFSLLGAYQPFDPQLQTVARVAHNSYPGFSQIQGAGTFNDLNQSLQLNYTQTLQTGTNLQLGVNSVKDSSNSGFYFLNPYYQSFLNLQVTQPLLRDRWGFASRAPLIIARRNLQQSRANFQAQVSSAVLHVVSQYWDVVLAKGNLDVVQQSLQAAQASYDHDKRALELGALPPLDIYRSESEVASRRVQVLQAEYTLKQTEDALRLTIGADQDNYVQALDLDLAGNPEPEGELRTIDAGTALQDALAKRPEIQIARSALENDDTSIRLAHNHLLPDLQLSAFYQGSGVGGNINVGSVLTKGGVGTSLNQLFSFAYPGYGASLTLNLPIKNRAAQAEMGTALVSRHHDLYSDQQVREQITLDVNNAVHQLEEAKLTLAAGKTALDLAQKTLSAEQRKYQLGAENIFFQLDAQTRVAQAQAGLLQAQVQYQNAIAALDYATGDLLQAYQVQIAELTK
ncbi:MAG TPA: TolC family protein [Terriglobales bacterium]|jgi:outer membrane protein TolC